MSKRMSVDDFQVMIQADTSDLLMEVTRDIYSGIVSRTPVRTGRARASWTIGVGAPDLRVHPDTGTPGNPIPAPKVPRFRLKEPQIIFIDNGLPYIQYLEFGSPTTQATGMVAATMAKYL